jgi:glycosyltransferase involved in cell wall biosynthesis
MRSVIVSTIYLDPAARGKLRALAGLGCTLSVAVPARWAATAKGPTLTAAWSDDGGVRVVPITLSDPYGEAARWHADDLRRLLSEFHPDLVQIEAEAWTPSAATVSRCTRDLGIPTVLFAWESLPRAYPIPTAWRRRRTVARLQGFIGGNRLAAALLARDRPGAPVTVLPQLGLTPPLEVTRPTHDELAIGFVGRLVPEKGLDTLLRACVKLLGRWRLTVVGSGPAQEPLEALAERLGIASRITWTGALPQGQLPQLWPLVDCLVVPSRSTGSWVETFHPSLLEAMGYGVTVIGTDSGALPELIDTAGMVVQEEDVPALTAALQHLVDSPRERIRLGQAARHRVMTQYVDDAIARRTLEFWGKVVGRR